MDKSLPLKIMSLKRIVWKEGSSFGKWFFIVLKKKENIPYIP